MSTTVISTTDRNRIMAVVQAIRETPISRLAVVPATDDLGREYLALVAVDPGEQFKPAGERVESTPLALVVTEDLFERLSPSQDQPVWEDGESA